jgi:hypothetical protein
MEVQVLSTSLFTNNRRGRKTDTSTMLISEAHPEKRLSAVCTGQTKKSAAEARVIKKRKSGYIPSNLNLRFERFV